MLNHTQQKISKKGNDKCLTLWYYIIAGSNSHKKLNMFTIKLKLTLDNYFNLCYNVFTVGAGF